MEKINFVNNSTPAINETNLNKLQDNAEDAIQEVINKIKTTETNSDTDTYSCNYINSSNSYSTNEVKTNKVWIDGKPIYRKVVDLGTIGGMHTTKTLYDGYYATIVDFGGYKYTSTNKMSLNSDTSSSNWMHVDYYIESSNDLSINVHRSSTGVWADWSIKIIIEYTKTTD